VLDHVVISLFADFGTFSVFRSFPLHEKPFAASVANWSRGEVALRHCGQLLLTPIDSDAE
jgi:hypothetical protein